MNTNLVYEHKVVQFYVFLRVEDGFVIARVNWVNVGFDLHTLGHISQLLTVGYDMHAKKTEQTMLDYISKANIITMFIRGSEVGRKLLCIRVCCSFIHKMLFNVARRCVLPHLKTKTLALS